MSNISYKSRVGASSITITPLHYAELNRHGITSGSATDFTTGSVVGSTSAWSRSSSFGMIPNTNGQITVAQTGRYRIKVGLNHYAAGGSAQFAIRVNGVSIQDVYVEGGDTTGDDMSWSTEKIHNLNINDVITLYCISTSFSGKYYGAGSYFIVEQIPTNVYIEPQLTALPTNKLVIQRGHNTNGYNSALYSITAVDTSTQYPYGSSNSFPVASRLQWTSADETFRRDASIVTGTNNLTINKTGVYRISSNAKITNNQSNSDALDMYLIRERSSVSSVIGYGGGHFNYSGAGGYGGGYVGTSTIDNFIAGDLFYIAIVGTSPGWGVQMQSLVIEEI